ncbi:MAG: hypothetical protein IPL32_03705 [Chloracidobacterium sp.]|nr:hypothetical protein [Chloracidobacterium sp.]
MKNHIFLTGMILACICFAASCGSKATCDPPLLLGPEESISPPNPNLQTDVFIDATLSMQGYAVDGSLSFYQQSIPMLERAVIKNGGQISFHKFGTEIIDLPGRSYGDAGQKAFYADGSINKKTLIEKVIDRANPEALTIIVTDLFQERADINQLSEKIKSKFISNNLAVGILGIRSQYNGRIFDVGTNNYSFGYSSTGESKTFRPFYLLALGTHSDIARYFDTLVAVEMSGFPDKQQVIFSKFLTAQPATWAKSKITETKGVNEVNGVLVSSQRGELSYKEFKVKGNLPVGTISAEIPYRPLANTVAFEHLQPSIEAFTCSSSDKKAGNADAVGQTIPNPAIAPALRITGELVNNEKIGLKLEIEAKRLDPKAICGYHVILRPASYLMPAWIDDWNMTGEQVETWHRDAGTFDGSKTYNLAPFLQTLWETNRQVNNPKVADFYCYFRNG